MSKSFSRAPKPQQLTADIISAFERGGAGQDTRGCISTIVGNREATNVGTEIDAPDTTKVEKRQPTKAEMGETTKVESRFTTEQGRAERIRRLSIDLPESWHRRFKIACTKTDKKMIDEVTEFIKRRTIELEKE